MSRAFSISELLKNLKVVDYSCPNDFLFKGVNINSEQIQTGNIFFALRGKKVDGHNFIKNAFENGAKICIIDHLTPIISENHYPFILVKNVLENLFLLAKYCRKTFNGKIIALTGSAGKSTTKNWLMEILQDFKKTYATHKNQNTDIGAALTLTNCEQDVEFCVMEVGMSTRGEISTSSKIIEPDIAIITNVKPVHIENFHSLTEIAHEKADIVDGLKENSCLFINYDETPFEEIKKYLGIKNKNLQIYTFGENQNCNCLLKSFVFNNSGISVCSSIFGEKMQFELQNVGEQFINNTLAILGIAKYLDLDIEQVASKLSKLHLYPGAGQVLDIKTLKGKIKIIDETYNANPAAVICAIRKLSSMDGKRKILILGDMYELGDYVQKGMDEIFESVITNKIDLVFTCGKSIKYLFDKLPMNIRGGHCEEVDVNILENVIKDGDIFLVKGSHGINLRKGRMYEFIEKLISYSI